MLVIFDLAVNLFSKPVTNKGATTMENTMKDKATPRPWNVSGSLIYKQSNLDYRIAKIQGNTGPRTDEWNAEFIVKAVNNYDALLDACKLWVEALPDLKCNKAYESIMADIIAKTNQAIAQATK
jgi:hypothetical protein